MTYEFETCRLSGEGNTIFPNEIIIDDEEEVVIHRKPKLIGCRETKIMFGAIASVQIDKHSLFADIVMKPGADARLLPVASPVMMRMK